MQCSLRGWDVHYDCISASGRKFFDAAQRRVHLHLCVWNIRNIHYLCIQIYNMAWFLLCTERAKKMCRGTLTNTLPRWWLWRWGGTIFSWLSWRVVSSDFPMNSNKHIYVYIQHDIHISCIATTRNGWMPTMSPLLPRKRRKNYKGLAGWRDNQCANCILALYVRENMRRMCIMMVMMMTM